MAVSFISAEQPPFDFFVVCFFFERTEPNPLFQAICHEAFLPWSDPCERQVFSNSFAVLPIFLIYVIK